MSQLEHWRGDFGRAYADRNVVDWRTRSDTLARLIPDDVNDVLEVGCNRGHNLLAIRETLGERVTVRGVEPADYPRGIARSVGLGVQAGDIYAIPHHADDFDLAFTSGVLIHVPTDRLHEAMREMARVARSYVLAFEYFAEEDTEVEYRGHAEMLWKRDYGLHYLRACPDLRLIGMGDDANGFERDRWWLLQKR